MILSAIVESWIPFFRPPANLAKRVIGSSKVSGPPENEIFAKKNSKIIRMLSSKQRNDINK